MIMTEDEAKTKFCPYQAHLNFMQLINASILLSVNKDLNISSIKGLKNDCTASGCMMWRSEKKNKIHVYGLDVGTIETLVKEQKNPSGYCGLSGKP